MMAEAQEPVQVTGFTRPSGDSLAYATPEVSELMSERNNAAGVGGFKARAFRVAPAPIFLNVWISGINNRFEER